MMIHLSEEEWLLIDKLEKADTQEERDEILEQLKECSKRNWQKYEDLPFG